MVADSIEHDWLLSVDSKEFSCNCVKVKKNIGKNMSSTINFGLQSSCGSWNETQGEKHHAKKLFFITVKDKKMMHKLSWV